MWMMQLSSSQVAPLVPEAELMKPRMLKIHPEVVVSAIRSGLDTSPTSGGSVRVSRPAVSSSR